MAQCMIVNGPLMVRALQLRTPTGSRGSLYLAPMKDTKW